MPSAGWRSPKASKPVVEAANLVSRRTTKPPRERGFEVELAGLEPATSWVR